MKTYEVTCFVGTVHATVEAESEDEAIDEALQQLGSDDILAKAIFFDVHEIEVA